MINCESDDAVFESYFFKKFRKMWKNKKANSRKDSHNPKAPTKGKFVPNSEKNPSKGSSKLIQYFECQGYGHTAAKCASRREKSKSKALNVSWDDKSEEEISEPESSTNGSGKYVAFMALSNVSSIQGLSNRTLKKTTRDYFKSQRGFKNSVKRGP